MLRIKRVHTQALREQVYALRYRAYLRENAIEECTEERFEDKYDSQPNHVLWALTENEEVIGSIRTTWFDPAEVHLIPEMIGYAEDLAKSVPENVKLLSGNRFVTSSSFDSSPQTAMLLLRHYMETAHYYQTEWAICAVRKNHEPFYRRVLHLKKHSEEGRIYPGLTCQMYLMSCDFKKNINAVYHNYPILKPKGYERLFFDENYQDVWEIGLPVEL